MSLLENKDRKYLMFGLKVVGDFGAIIAIPVILFVFIGKWVDNRYDTNPWFTIFAFILAASLSAKMLHKKAYQYGKEFDKIEQTND